MYSSSIVVNTAAPTYDLVDLNIVKEELGVTDTSHDAILSLYISSESEKIAQYCNRVFPSEVVTESFILNDKTSLVLLSRSPIVEFTSLTLDGKTLDATEYNLNSATGALSYLNSDGSVIPFPGVTLVASYEGGYAVLPYAVQDACLRQVTSRWFSRAKDPSVKVEEVTNVGRQEYWVGPTSEGLPPDVEMGLGAFKRWCLA